jgi:serine/threonine-protein kinase RsbW
MLIKVKIESDITNLVIVENEIDNVTSQVGVNQDNYGKILVSTLEAVNNAIIHGNKSDAGKFVEIEISLKKDLLQVTVTDEGKGFHPEGIPDPTLPENLELINGRGIFLMSKLADEIKFNKRGNSVKLTFKNILS